MRRGSTTYAGDRVGCRQHVLGQYQAVTVVGIAPQGFYGDRLSSTPPDFYLPIESMTGAGQRAVCARSGCRVGLHRWAGEAGRGAAGRCRKDECGAAAGICSRASCFTDEQGKKLLAKVHVVLTPGGAGIQALAGAVYVASAVADVDCGAGAAGCLREYREPAAGAGHGTARGDVHAHGAGGDRERGSFASC